MAESNGHSNGQEAPRSKRGGYTPTERRMLAVLADGMRHPREELVACLWDELSKPSTIQYHLSNIRKVLRPMGQDIICEYYQHTFFYRHVRLLTHKS